MESLYRFSEIEILGYILVLLRLGSFFAAWPIFGSEAVPAPIKVLLALTVSFLVFPLVGWKKLSIGISDNQIIIYAFKEVFVGLALGFFCRLTFFALAMGGQLISISMGLSSAQLFNPSLGLEGNAVEQFKVMLGSLFFLFISGHHLFLTGIVKSFELVPLNRVEINLGSFGDLGLMMSEIFALGIRIAAPVMISVLFMNIALGLAGRAVPQINVLVTSMPVNTLVGILTMVVALPLFVTEIHQILELMTTRLFSILKSF